MILNYSIDDIDKIYSKGWYNSICAENADTEKIMVKALLSLNMLAGIFFRFIHLIKCPYVIEHEINQHSNNDTNQVTN